MTGTLTMATLREALARLPPDSTSVYFVSPAVYRMVEREAPHLLSVVRKSQIVGGTDIIDVPKSWLPRSLR